MKFSVVDTWLDAVAYSHSKSPQTRYAYKLILQRFCGFIEKTPEEIVKEYNQATDREFKRRYAYCIKAFIGKLDRDGYAPTSIIKHVAVVKSFMKYNDLPLGHVPVAKPRITFHNRDITKEEIQEILVASKPRDRAFFIMMAQSGLRPDTLCKLKLKHIEPDFSNGCVPCKIEVPADATKGEYHSYFSFMGNESLEALNGYFSIRPQMTKESYLFTLHGTERQANPKSLSTVFMHTIEKLKAKGLMEFEQEKYNKPRNIRLYNLRKFFRKYANQAGFEFVQFWMGHVVKEGVDEHYRPKDVEFHRQLYAEKAMPYLRLETATPSETEQTINELKQKVESRNQEIEQARAEVEELKKLTKTFKEELDRQRKLIDTFYQMTNVKPVYLQEAYEKSVRDDDLELQEQREEEQARLLPKLRKEWEKEKMKRLGKNAKKSEEESA